jgi:hypothetical protein
MPYQPDRIDEIFNSLNDKSCEELRVSIENSRHTPTTDRRRLYASYEDIEMRAPSRSEQSNSCLTSVQGMLRRLAHSG